MDNSAFIQFDFEDGVFDLDRNPNSQVPTRIAYDPDGNAYLRIEANYGDQDWIPKVHEDRVRSFVWATERHAKMAPLTEDNKAQSYSADIRFMGYEGATGRVTNQFFELFQTSSTNPETGYGDRSGDTGPNIRLTHSDTGQVRVSYTTKDEAGQTVWHSASLGRFEEGVFYNFRIEAVWSHDAAEGRYAVYVDDVLAFSVADIATNVGPTADLLPSLKIGLYGDNAVGVVHVDNIDVAPLQELRREVQVDEADAYAWTETVTTYDAADVAVLMERRFDDGRVSETRFQDGIRAETVTRDAGEAWAWDINTVRYDAEGKRAEGTRVYDDGRVATTVFDDGARVRTETIDVKDAFAWDWVKTTFDAEGDRLTTQRVFDNGRVVETAFQEGVISERVVLDQEDRWHWESRTSVFDAAGDLLQRTVVFDDGAVDVFVPEAEIL